MNRRRTWICALSAATILLVASAYAFRGRPVLLHVLAETGCACGDFHEEVTGIVIRNPFRDVSAEHAGTTFLEGLASDQCVGSSSLCQYALPDHRVSGWRLINRHDAPDRVQLFYRLTKYGESDSKYKLTGEGLIEVTPQNGTWVVTDYSSYF